MTELGQWTNEKPMLECIIRESITRMSINCRLGAVGLGRLSRQVCTCMQIAMEGVGVQVHTLYHCCSLAMTGGWVGQPEQTT